MFSASSSLMAQDNTRPILITADEVVMNVTEVPSPESGNFAEFSVNDLLKKVEDKDVHNFEIYDLENWPTFFTRPAFDGGVELVFNMGIAVTVSEAGGSEADFIEFHSGVQGSTWFSQKNLSGTHAQLLTPDSRMRINLAKIPQGSESFKIGFKLWDMSNQAGLDLTKPKDTTLPDISSPFSLDTQVVYFKMPGFEI